MFKEAILLVLVAVVYVQSKPHGHEHHLKKEAPLEETEKRLSESEVFKRIEEVFKVNGEKVKEDFEPKNPQHSGQGKGQIDWEKLNGKDKGKEVIETIESSNSGEIEAEEDGDVGGGFVDQIQASGSGSGSGEVTEEFAKVDTEASGNVFEGMNGKHKGELWLAKTPKNKPGKTEKRTLLLLNILRDILKN